MRPDRTGVRKSRVSQEDLWHPVRKDLHFFRWLHRIIRYEMHTKIMVSIHACMHHKDRGCDRGAFTGLKDHRTDGQLGRSAPLPDLNIGWFLEPQGRVASVGNRDRECKRCVQPDITKIDDVLIHA